MTTQDRALLLWCAAAVVVLIVGVRYGAALLSVVSFILNQW